MNFVKRISQVVITFAALVLLTGMVAMPVNAAEVHNVTFMYGNKTFVEPVAHGANAIAPVDTYVEGYTFKAWVGNMMNVTEDRIILGDYVKNVAVNPVAVYTVNFVDGLTGRLLSTQVVQHGANAVAPEVPQHWGYRFTGWSDSYYCITSNRTIYATYDGRYWFCGVPYSICYGYYGWNVYPYYWFYNNWYGNCSYKTIRPYVMPTRADIVEATNARNEELKEFGEDAVEAQKELKESISEMYDSLPGIVK